MHCERIALPTELYPQRLGKIYFKKYNLARDFEAKIMVSEGKVAFVIKSLIF